MFDLIILLLFLLILSFLVLTHEFGHFILARRFKVKVEEFGLGLPPRLVGIYTEAGKKKWVFGSAEVKTESTLYSLNLIPFGGFNKIYGEEVREEKELKEPESFASKSLAARTLIVSGGILFGILAAAIIFYFILAFNQFSAYQGLLFEYKFPFGSQRNFPMAVEVREGSPAETAKLLPFDLVLQADGQKLKSTKNLIELIKASEGKEVLLRVKNLRTEEIREIVVVPQVEPPETIARIGVGLREVAQIGYISSFEKISVGFLHSANLLHYSLVALYDLFKRSFDARSITPLADQTAGLVGIFAITKLTIEKIGLAELFNLIALLSLALAITNFLPLPALDGGRLVFLGYEAIFRKRIPPIIERKIHAAGLLGLIVLCCLITYNDILRFKDILF